jgi:hypothetical protein
MLTETAILTGIRNNGRTNKITAGIIVQTESEKLLSKMLTNDVSALESGFFQAKTA